MKVNFGLVAGIKAMPCLLQMYLNVVILLIIFGVYLPRFDKKKHFTILYWNKLIQGGNALWIKYVFLNQAKRVIFLYNEVKLWRCFYTCICRENDLKKNK